MVTEEPKANPKVPRNRDREYMQKRTGKARGGRPPNKLSANSTLDAPASYSTFPTNLDATGLLRLILAERAGKDRKPRTKLEAVVRVMVNAAQAGDIWAVQRVLDPLEGKPGRAQAIKATGDNRELMEQLDFLLTDDIRESLNRDVDAICAQHDPAEASPALA